MTKLVKSETEGKHRIYKKADASENNKPVQIYININLVVVKELY